MTILPVKHLHAWKISNKQVYSNHDYLCLKIRIIDWKTHVKGPELNSLFEPAQLRAETELVILSHLCYVGRGDTSEC